MTDDCNGCKIRREWLDVHLRADNAPDFLARIADLESQCGELRANNYQMCCLLAAQTVAAFLWRIGRESND